MVGVKSGKELKIKVQDRLSAGGLLSLLRSGFEEIEDHRTEALVKISLADTLMSAFAMFSLKDPSLLAFDERILSTAIDAHFAGATSAREI